MTSSTKRKEEGIIQILEKHNVTYQIIKKESSLNIIYDLFINNNMKIINTDYDDPQIYLYFGIYYKRIRADYDNALKYYKKGYELDDKNTAIVHNLALCYACINNNDKMEEYLLIGCKLKIVQSVIFLAKYYRDNERYEEMIKYYELAIELGSDIPYHLLGEYYREINDFDNMKKFLFLGIQKNNITCIEYLNKFLNENFDLELALNIRDKLSKDNFDTLQKYLIKYYEIKDLCNRYNHLNIKINSKEECIICRENKYYICLPCSHKLCYSCINKLEKCPFCQKKIK